MKKRIPPFLAPRHHDSQASTRPPPRSILITGCSTGIGWHAAKQLRQRGWRVFATARRPSDLKRLDVHGMEALYLDYSEEASISALVQRVHAQTQGRLDAVFNNGAYAIPAAVEDLPTQALRDQFEVNFFGWHALTRALLPAMLKHRKGRIVQCSSVLGMAAMRFRGAYAASKFALEGLNEALRLELDGTGVHIIMIRPGPIFSRFRENARRAFLRDIDWNASRFRDRYMRLFALSDTPETDPDAPRRSAHTSVFKLGPDAVFHALLHAIASPRPRPMYRVTSATTLVDATIRIGSARMRHWILGAVSDA